MKLIFIRLIQALKKYRLRLDENDVIKLTLYVKANNINKDDIESLVKDYVENKEAESKKQATIEQFVGNGKDFLTESKKFDVIIEGKGEK